MSKEKYRFTDEVKKIALENSLARGKQDVHHIVSRSTATKYNLDSRKIKSQENAIALEQDGLHAWLHGKQLSEEDVSMEWKGLEDSDYIDLAIALLGFEEKDFSKIYPRKANKKKRRKKRGKRKRRGRKR